MTIKQPKPLLRHVLKLGGCVEVLAFFAVVMPRAWMESAHEWLGLGVMPPLPVLDYMIRGASFTLEIPGSLRCAPHDGGPSHQPAFAKMPARRRSGAAE